MQRTILALGVGATVLCTTMAHAQTSEYFLMAGDQGMFHVLQGGVLVRSWPVAVGTHQYQYPIAVIDTIRTTGAAVGEVGGEYDFNGILIGPRYIHPAGTARSWDGTTDGESNYAIGADGAVHRFDREWGNPVLLLNAGGLGGITYDPTNNSLWVSQWDNSTLTNYTLDGVVISSFSTGHAMNMALALDHADQTLWLHDRSAQGTFEQWTKTGSLVQRIAVAGMEAENAVGGEMPFGGVCVCPEDIDRDGTVAFSDILRILGAWGSCYDCEPPGACGNFPLCDGEGCICVTGFDGSGQCYLSVSPCGEPCPDGDCPPGFICIRDTCCGPTTCLPAAAACPTGAVPLPPPGARVIAGVIGPDGSVLQGKENGPRFGMLSATGPWQPAGPGVGTGHGRVYENGAQSRGDMIASATLSVSDIGPFTGVYSESWESFQNYNENPLYYEASPATIFGGAAQIFNNLMAVYEPNVAPYSLNTSGLAQVADGTQGMGLDSSGQTAVIVFEEPVATFGAFWGATTDDAGSGDPAFVELLFFDGGGGLIDIVQFTYSRTEQGADGVLEWHGWQSTAPINRVEYVGNFVVIDAMQADPVDPCLQRPCPEDLDGDGLVAFSDILEVLAAWGPCDIEGRGINGTLVHRNGTK